MVPGLDKRVLLVGREAINRSVDGDVVVVEILPKDQWKAPGEEVVDQDGTLCGPFVLRYFLLTSF
jgi:exosome complex exonuclease DIS3/RRP44